MLYSYRPTHVATVGVKGLSCDGEYTLCKRTIYWIYLQYYNEILALYSVAADYSSNEDTDVS